MKALPQLLADRADRPLVAPGVYDALTARLAEAAGFDALYLSGAGLSYASYGRPDIGYTGLRDVEEATARIASRIDVPLIVDADHAFGGPANAAVAMRRLEAAGAAAVQIEDQAFPKRCGHLGGKSVIAADEMGAKIAAARAGRRHAATLVIARTDALAIEGRDAALDRAELYLAAGADILFIEAPRDLDDLHAIATRFSDRVPLIANMVDGGRTPLMPATTLADLGYAITLFPGGTTRALVRALGSYFGRLAAEGDIAPLLPDLAGFDELNDLLGLAEDDALEDRMRDIARSQSPSG